MVFLNGILMELIFILYVFFVWNFDGIDMDFIWFFSYGILMALIWVLYRFFFAGIDMDFICFFLYGIDMDFIWFFCIEF